MAAQQTKADQKPIEEVKAKAEAGDAESEVELGLRYDKGEGVMKIARRPRSGSAKPSTRMTPRRNTIWASAITRARAWRRTKLRR